MKKRPFGRFSKPKAKRSATIETGITERMPKSIDIPELFRRLQGARSDTGAGAESLGWLAQIVWQVKTVGWESDFACEGVSGLTEFRFLISEIESLDPVSCAVHLAGGRDHGSAAQTFQKITAVQFARKLDALIELLDVTTDALAAAWDQRTEASGRKGARELLAGCHSPILQAAREKPGCWYTKSQPETDATSAFS